MQNFFGKVIGKNLFFTKSSSKRFLDTLILNQNKDHSYLIRGTQICLAVSFISYLTYDKIYCNGRDTRKNSELYAWGSNAFGQLGIGSENTATLPQRIDELKDIQLKTIEARSHVSAAVSENGNVYTWGKAKGGALGHEDFTTANVNLPTLLESIGNNKFSKIACGISHMAAITQEGHLYTWGNNEHGRLGHPKENSNESKKSLNSRSVFLAGISKPKKVEGELSQKKIVDAACGSMHTLCLTSEGEVYAWGSNRKGVLGNDDNKDIYEPQKLKTLEGKKVIKVGAGYDYSVALTQEGALYSWGNNDFGQLGNPNKNPGNPPAYVHALNGVKIVDFACGENYVAALSEKGQLYTWGYGNEGQLGHGNKSDLKAPKLLEFDKKIIQVACGNGHTAFITENGDLYLFGRGREGQLGREGMIESAATYRTIPTKVESLKAKKFVQVVCGDYHTLALTENI